MQPENFYAGIANEMIQRRREKRVLDGLEDLARHLGGLRDERKAVITVSNGWLLFTPNPSLARHAPCERPPGVGQVGTTPDGRITTDRVRSDYGYSKYDCETDRQMLAHLNNAQDYRDLTDVANANNVSFYPVDARGLAAVDRDINENPVLGPAAEISLVQERVESLRTLADNTDGLAVVDTNDLDKGFQRIVDDMTSYYLLGYYSTNTRLDGKVRKIKVRVKRDGVDVRARRSYRAPTEKEIEEGTAQMTAAAAATPASALQAALNSIGSSRAGIPLRTAVSYAMVGGGARRAHVWALAELDPGLLRGEEWHGGGEVDVLLQSADGPDQSAHRHTGGGPAIAERGPRGRCLARGRVGGADASQASGWWITRQRYDPVDAIGRCQRAWRACLVTPWADHRGQVHAHGRQAVSADRSRPGRAALLRWRRDDLGGGSQPSGQVDEHSRHDGGTHRGHADVGDGGSGAGAPGGG